LDRDTPLTQYGDTWEEGFRCRPRFSDFDGISVIEGRLSVREAARLVCRKRLPFRGDAVRHTTVGQLEDAGFSVRPTPTRGNPGHVSVQSAQGWDDDVCELFHRSFGPPEVE
jgi:hypothetical protein